MQVKESLVVLKAAYLVDLILWNMSKDGSRLITSLPDFEVLMIIFFYKGLYQADASLQVFGEVVGRRDEESVGVHKRI